MSVGRHSFVAFYPSDWVGGTFRLPRLVKSVYFDVCLYNWDKYEAMPKTELAMMLMDLDSGQGDKIIDVLVDSGKLVRDESGAIFSPRAMKEAGKSFDLWQQKSAGGKRAAERRAAAKEGEQQESKQDSTTERATSTEPSPEPSPDPTLVREGSPPLSDDAPKADASADDATQPPEPLKPPEPDKSAKARPTAAQCAEVIGAWNEMAAKHGLAQAVKMTAAREGAARVRIEEMGLDDLRTAIAMVPERPFLIGRNERKWKADIDWFLRPNSAAAVLEGSKYMDAGGGSAWREME